MARASSAQLSLLEHRVTTPRAAVAGAIPLLEWRETPRKKSAPLVVGHAVIDGDEIRFEFPLLKLHSLNKSGFGMSRGAAMAEMARVRLVRETVKQSVLFVVGAQLRPSSVTVTRLSTGSLDDDNLVGSMKSCRDGIARALGFDDRLFAVIPPGVNALAQVGRIPFFPRQASSGKRGVFGCRVVLDFGKVATT